MRPIDIDVMLHHYVSAARYHTSSEEATTTEEELVEIGMLERVGVAENPTEGTRTSGYKITTKGETYIKALLKVPVPVTSYVVNWPLNPTYILEEGERD